jgi:hypothetical protein
MCAPKPLLHEQTEFRCPMLNTVGSYSARTGIGGKISLYFSGFPQSPKQVLEYYLKLGNTRFLPYIFKFIIY